MATDRNIQSVLNKQRLDKFRIVLVLPEVLRGLNTSNWSVTEQNIINRDSLQFSLYSAMLPEVSIPSRLLPTQGQTMKVTSQARDPYTPVNCKFVVDNRFKNSWVLWKWLEAINNPRHSGMDNSLALQSQPISKGQLDVGDTNFLGYQSKLSIFPLDEYNKEMCEFIFYNAFITKLGGANFNYQDSNQIESDFTFDFSQLDIRIIE